MKEWEKEGEKQGNEKSEREEEEEERKKNPHHCLNKYQSNEQQLGSIYCHGSLRSPAAALMQNDNNDTMSQMISSIPELLFF